jgi:dihydroorotate dehydrogenase electron transfer subunit
MRSSAAGACPDHPLAAAYYADRARPYRLQVVENAPLARDTWRIRLAGDALAREIVPGQFLMVRLPDRDDPLLARPFALYDTVLDDSGRPWAIDVAYLVVGRMTRRLAQCRAGDWLECWGPLGNGFASTPIDHLVLVAGGIGQTPFLALGREALGGRRYGTAERPAGYARRVTLCYGVRTAELLAGADDFRAAGLDLQVSSDDGSVGRHGLVTELLREILAAAQPGELRIATCGPEPMMHAVAQLAHSHGVACEASLETPMACGIGICFSCVAKVRESSDAGDDAWDYKRTCVEGPVFDASKIVW